MTLPRDLSFAPREEYEGLFSRDLQGQLVRVDKPTEEDFRKEANVWINDRAIRLPLAEPLKDAEGNIVQKLNGKPVPRKLTILDAILRINAQNTDQPEITVPTLCHQPHMQPVAVCRLCLVALYRDGKPEKTPVPACQYAISGGMQVYTTGGPKDSKYADVVRSVTGIVTDLLQCENLHAAPEWASEIDRYNFNELGNLKGCADPMRFAAQEFQDPPGAPPVAEPPTGRRGVDSSSPVFHVDHSSCILCERCIRACTEVRHNDIIGRTGKGWKAGIGFDLNLPMGESNCVQCGECMMSCPTSAITYKTTRTVETRKGAVPVPPEELMKDPLFRGVPPKFLLWQKGLVLRRKLNVGDVLCRTGDPGNSAYVMKSCELAVTPPASQAKPIIRGPGDVIVGEMSCLSGTPRTADVSAHTSGEVWEIRRNVLDRMMQSPGQRKKFDQIYRENSLAVVLDESDAFKGVASEERQNIADFLRGKDDKGRDRLAFVRVNPNQTILRQGDRADCMYLVRLGHVRVGVSHRGHESVVLILGPGTSIGEIGLLGLNQQVVQRDLEDVQREVASVIEQTAAADLPDVFLAGVRTSTCTSLDHVEMARIDRNHFLELIQRFPHFRRHVVEVAYNRLAEHTDQRQDTPLRREFVSQGLYQGQSLLVLDLTKCTRCDECTRACTQQHGTASHGQPLARLSREGLRFGDYLVATSCRSCKDAYCMIGCPVDAIFRGKHGQIVIADHCIGCGLCAQNCPYGNISMQENLRELIAVADLSHPGGTRMIPQRKASTCDLCDRDGRELTPLPRCVLACPHDAAHRMTGAEFLKAVSESASDR